MIGRQRDLVADDIADLPDVFHQGLNAEIGELNAAQGMHDMPREIPLRRRGDRAIDAFEQADADIHLEKLETIIHAALEPFAHLPTIEHGIGIAVYQRLVAELAASQLIGGDAISFAGEIKEGHLNAADAAALPAVVAELLDLSRKILSILQGFSPSRRDLSSSA